jgi:hypothetical protein
MYTFFKKLGVKILLIIFIVLPQLTLAQFPTNTNTPGKYSTPTIYPFGNYGYGGGTPRTFGDFVSLIAYYINLIVPVLIGLAVLGLFWGIFRYAFFSQGGEGIEDAKKIILYGIIGLVVMVSLWGILRLLAQTFL